MILPQLRIVKGPDSRGEYVAWCPFHDDGNGKPPHQPNLCVSERGFICHACGEKGSLTKLAKKLGIEMENLNNQIEATYDYLDEDGNPLFQQVRKPGKRFMARRPDGKGDWIWNLKEVKRVLYNLPELTSRTDEPVFIVEGEKDADRLMKEGLLATTNPNGANKWRDEYSNYLQGRDVFIIPDNDEPGRKHAESVAKSVVKVANSVKIIELPDLPEKGDVSDWLDAGKTIEELQQLVNQTDEWKLPVSGQPNGDSNPREEKETQAERIVRIFRESGPVLFKDERGKPYASVLEKAGRRNISMDSPEFTTLLDFLTYNATGSSPSNEAMASARRTLQGLAKHGDIQYDLHIRVAWYEGAIWIDKDGYKAIRVTGEGWEIIDDPPILFRSFSHQHPLPDPIPGGDPWKVLDFLNVQDTLSRLAVMCYIPAAMVPDIPCNAIILHGGQGTAKSTLLKVIKSLLDPSDLDLNVGFSKPENFILTAWQSRMLNIDNLSSLPEWLSNSLCCTVTGAGQATRTHYTMEDLNILKIRRVVGLSGINLVADKPDLLERSTIFTLQPIPPENRREELEFWEEFESVRPSIIGGFLDVLSRMIKLKSTIKLERPPRMMDFGLWGASAAVALGHTVEEYQQLVDSNSENQNSAAIEASPLAQVVVEMVKELPSGEWDGSPAEFLEIANEYAPKLQIRKNSPLWPSNPTWTVRRLNEIQASLLAVGIEVTVVRKSQGSTISLRKISAPGGHGMRVNSDGSEVSVILEPASETVYGGNGGNDAIFPSSQTYQDDNGKKSDPGDEFDDIRHLLSTDPGSSGEDFEYGW